MRWRVELSRQAARSFGRLATPDRRRIGRAIDQLAKNARPPGKLVKAIQGSADAFLRYRVGDYRILYEVIDSDSVVLVLGIVTRGDLEGWLRRRN